MILEQRSIQCNRILSRLHSVSQKRAQPSLRRGEAPTRVLGGIAKKKEGTHSSGAQRASMQQTRGWTARAVGEGREGEKGGEQVGCRTD